MQSPSHTSPPHPGEPSQLLHLPEKLFYMNYMPVQTDIYAHHHQNLEMAFLVGGKGVQRTTSGEAACHAGDVYLIPPGVWHAYVRCRNLALYNCHLSQPLLDGPLAWATEDPSMGLLLKPDPWHGSSRVLAWKLPNPALAQLRTLLAELLLCYKKNGDAHRGELVGRLLLLLGFVAHHGRPTHTPNTAPVHSAVRRAAEQLQANPAKAWSLPELAEELRINPSYLVRIFRQATGCAPMKFLAKERAHKAAQLLLTSELPVSEIGERVGWDEPKQFARAFHQHFGESATKFRQRLKRG